MNSSRLATDNVKGFIAQECLPLIMELDNNMTFGGDIVPFQLLLSITL